MAEIPLSNSLLKVSRAGAQVGALAQEIRNFLEGKPYRVARNLDHVAGYAAFVTRVDKSSPPIWSVIIGECLHNLRSALDYMIWDLVILQTGERPRTNKTQFPIFETEGGYDRRSQPLLHGVGSQPRAVIKEVQPFSTGESHRNPLWHLHELSNWDKHRSLRLAGAFLDIPDKASFPLPPATAAGSVTSMSARAPGPFKDGTELIRNTFTGCWTESSTDVTIDGNFRFDVCFDEAGPMPGVLIVPTLVHIQQRVFQIGQRLAAFWVPKT